MLVGMSVRLSLLGVFGLLGLLGACRRPERSVDEDSPEDWQATASHLQGGPTALLPAAALPVPLVRQRQSYSCGDAVTLALLRYWKSAEYRHTLESALYGPLHTTPQEGTDPQPMANFLARVPGLQAEYRADGASAVELADLERAVDRGDPPIVGIQAWQEVKSASDLRPWSADWDDGHYVVLIAHDSQNLFFMDPSTAGHYTYIPRADFPERWHDVVGPEHAHASHMTIFVHGMTTPFRPTRPLPPKATAIY